MKTVFFLRKVIEYEVFVIEIKALFACAFEIRFNTFMVINDDIFSDTNYCKYFLSNQLHPHNVLHFAAIYWQMPETCCSSL